MKSDDKNACGSTDTLSIFSDPQVVARYAEVPRRFVPGLDALHRMAGVLLAEGTPSNAKVLVIAAGGGMELAALADAHPTWTFVGVDPAAEMLRLAERTLGPRMDRVELIEGYVDDAPPGPFDAATCLLMFHLLSATERARTARAIHERLRPGAPFVAAHLSFPQQAEERTLWLARYAAYGIASGAEPEGARGASVSIGARLELLDPENDEAILRESGFRDATPFFAAFTWRGWIGHA